MTQNYKSSGNCFLLSDCCCNVRNHCSPSHLTLIRTPALLRLRVPRPLIIWPLVSNEHSPALRAIPQESPEDAESLQRAKSQRRKPQSQRLLNSSYQGAWFLPHSLCNQPQLAPYHFKAGLRVSFSIIVTSNPSRD